MHGNITSMFRASGIQLCSSVFKVVGPENDLAAFQYTPFPPLLKLCFGSRGRLAPVDSPKKKKKKHENKRSISSSSHSSLLM